MKRSFADIMAGLDGERAQKVARKLPAWAAVDGLEFPTALSLEQCSSTATALYKAGQAAAAANLRFAHPSHAFRRGPLPFTRPRAATGLPAAPPDPAKEEEQIGIVLDLTGGLGVDSWAFAQVAERVVYFEQNAELAAAAGRNFTRLGVGNIDVRCETVTPQTELPEADLIYADPARRDAAGRKVFLLEDCTPDILTLLPQLLQKAPAVLLKLSPMADLTLLAGRLGPALREIHVVECDGEVKELLCLLLRDNAAPEPDIVVARLNASRGGSSPPDVQQKGVEVRFAFRMSEERAAEAVYAAGVQPGDVLLEPCPALLKAGAFRLPCERWGLRKLASSTHLYLLSTDYSGFDLESPGNRLFKALRVVEVLSFGAAAFKELRRRYPRAEVTARNLPLGSDALRRKLGVAPGGEVHIFGCRLADGSAVLLVTESCKFLADS